MSMHNKSLFSLTGLAVLAVGFVAAVIVSNTLLRGVRFDMTENQLYTITEGTRNILESIDEPINLYLFFSDEVSADLTAVRAYANRVREMLEEFALAADGKIRLEVIDPAPFSEEEDQAAQFGLQAVPVGPAAENLYFGLAGTNAVDGTEIIPFFQSNKERFLEYDLAKLVHNLANPKQPVIGLMSSLPMTPDFDPMTRQMREPWVIYTQMQQLFDVRNVATTATSIEDDIDLLMIVHPKDLSDGTLFAIDQFLLGGGRAIVFVDPHAEIDLPPQDPNNPMAAMMADRSSSLDKLLGAWGVEVPGDKVVGDRRFAVQVPAGPNQRPVPHIGILGLAEDAIDPDDIVTSELATITVALSGYIETADEAKVTVSPLLRSSTESAPIGTDKLRFMRDPGTLRDGFVPDEQRYVLAARLTGNVPTAYPDGAPATDLPDTAVPGDLLPGGGDTDGETLLTSGDINVVLVADADILSDRLWVQVQNFFGQRIFSAWANNGDLVVNALDNLTGSSDLIAIRGRASSARPFERVDALKREADDRFRAVEQRLQQELEQTEARLGELQSARNDADALIMTPEQQAEIEQFLAEKLRIRKELRQVRRDLDKDIERLGTWLKVINIAGVPLVLIAVALIGIALRSKRRRRETTRVEGTT